jgi:soluble lytic murein transglycosylase-like protein
MSSQAIEAATLGQAPGEAAAATRIRQLQGMIEQARAAADGTTTGPAPSAAGQPSSFAAALQAATAPTATPASAASQPGSSSQYDALIESSAARNGVDPAILHGLIQQESGFDPSSRSSAGAVGLTQLMPGTASSLGVANPADPAESIEGGARYLAQMMSRFGGNTTDALAAYNAGPGAVQQYGGVPPYPETQSYVEKVLGYAEGYRREHPSTGVLGAQAA